MSLEFEGLMGNVLLGGMFAGVGMGGMDAQDSAQGIRDQINAISDRTTNLKSKFSSYTKTNAADRAQMNIEITSLLDSITQSNAALQINQTDYTATLKRIQMYGIIFVVCLFFMLLLKRVGIFDALNKQLKNTFSGMFK